MDANRQQEEDLQHREQDLKERELSIRFRELEAEVNQPPPKAIKHDKTKSAVKPRYRLLFKVGKFVALMVVAGVAIRIAAGFANVLILLAIAWAVYKVFFESDRPKR